MLAHALSWWVTILVVGVGGVLVHHANETNAHPAYPVSIHLLYAFLALNAFAATANTIAILNKKLGEFASNIPVPILVGFAASVLAMNSAMVSVVGGVRGPFWLAFIPSVLFSSLLYPVRAAIGLGFLADAFLFWATYGSSHQHMSSATWAEYFVVFPLFPLLGWLTSTLGMSIAQTAQSAAHSRDVVTNHVRAVSRALDEAAAGNLSVPVPKPVDADAPEALNQLSDALGATLTDLRGLVDHVRGGGEQVGASAAELLATAEQHAASATQQSTAVTETTTTIEELAATAAQIAETAEAVARYAAETLRYAEQGQEAVNASVDAMDTIGGSVDAMARRALTLGERTHEIGRIVEVIDDLADQTNLLALNAAIEAARAGDHGRGFAVVATEIRKLAERAQSSTSQIRTIVGEVQAETHATIVASEEGAKEARVGAELARGVADALELIGGMVDETTTAAKEISIATQQQRSASEQVVAAMTQVSDVARQYAVGSQQTSASAAQLHGLASQLREAISRFTVDAWPPPAIGMPSQRDVAEVGAAH